MADTSALDEFWLDIEYNLAVRGVLDDVSLLTDNLGETPIVVALEGEDLSALMRRIGNVGGIANLFVKIGNGARYISFLSIEDALNPQAGTDYSEVSSLHRLHAGSKVADLVKMLAQYPDGVRIPRFFPQRNDVTEIGSPKTVELVSQ